MNLAIHHGTDTVVLMTCQTKGPTLDERLQVLEVTLWLVDEGWTGVTTATSPLADIVQKGAPR